MAEYSGMPKKFVDRLGRSGLPTASRQADPAVWCRPKLVKLQPGTLEHERAKIAIELMNGKENDKPEPQ